MREFFKPPVRWRAVLGRAGAVVCLLATACSALSPDGGLPETSQPPEASPAAVTGLPPASATASAQPLDAMLITPPPPTSPPGALSTAAATPASQASGASGTPPTSLLGAPSGTSSGAAPGGKFAGKWRFLPLVFSSGSPIRKATMALWVDPQLPPALRQGLALPEEYGLVENPAAADLRLEVLAGPAEGRPVLSRWIYALAVPFPTFEEVVPGEELVRSWAGGGRTLIMEPSTLAVFTALWGAPAAGAVQSMPAGDLLSYAWGNPKALALLPFETLEPRWKVLTFAGQNPVRKDFDPAGYPLSVPITLNGDQALAGKVAALYGPGTAAPLVPDGNRSPKLLTVVAMTGVTALVRATASTMEREGINYPGKDVRDLLLAADLTHISNEVPFARDCPPPNPLQLDMHFCSDPRYIRLLEDVGTDIVELTGDHFQDWGADAMLYTLDLYKERGWPVYGGGEDLKTARQAVTLEHNGNRLAFIGCNAKGGGYAQAGADRPGAAACDMDWLEREVAGLAQAGYLPIVTFQHFEYYTYEAQPDQRHDFRAAAQAGAVVVSGSQAHQPQALEFRTGDGGTTLIHYGLGNLFFDQFDVSQACRQAFIDYHIFYNGRYIGAQLLPILFVDYARARPMKPDERQELLQAVYRASGW